MYRISNLEMANTFMYKTLSGRQKSQCQSLLGKLPPVCLYISRAKCKSNQNKTIFNLYFKEWYGENVTHLIKSFDS